MDHLIALVPSIGVALLFFLVIRYFFRADRIERDELAELDRAEQAVAARAQGRQNNQPEPQVSDTDADELRR